MTEHTQPEEPMGDVIPFTGRTSADTPATDTDATAPRPATVPDDQADESSPANTDGPALDGEIVRVDRPDTGPRDWLSDLEGRTKERRPIVPAWARSHMELRATVAWVGAHYAHVAGYHGSRVPLYAARMAARAPRGLFRTVGGFVRWTFDLEGEPVRLAAVRKADPEAYLKLSRQRDSRVRLRVAVAIGAVALTVAALIVVLAAPSAVHWTVFAAVVAALGVIGAPADRPLIDRAVIAAQVEKLTSDIVVRALGSLNNAAINQAIAKGRDGIQFLAPITRDGPGYRADVNLPHGVTVNDVIERRDRLASGLRRPLGCVWPEAVPGEHTGRLLLWVGDNDMAKTKQPAWPLRRNGTVDLFKAAPFGTDQRGRWVPLTLMYVSVIIGAIPRMGKTFLLRLLLLIAAQDPRAEIHAYDLKGTGDLSPLEAVAHRHRAVEDDEEIAYALADLRSLRTELRRRAKVIRELPKDICPESKVTPDLAGKKSLGLHPIVIAVDECQVWFEHAKHGDEFEAICTDLVKRGPALGMVLILATQRPDSKALPTGISANASVRLCLKVMGQMENDMVLGTSQYKNGVRATMFSFNDKGICYFVGDGDEPRIVRSVYVDAPEAEKIALQARAVRERQGRLSGYALGAESDVDTGPAYDLLADVLAVTSADEGRVWNETVVERLAELRPEMYGAWKPEQLTVALKPYGAETVQVAKRIDGKTINRRGIDPTRIAELVTERNGNHGGG
ncbi:MAG TPA: cell division protein FtsK [Streptosporangiaceae bacterium]|jgi:S-DNA-T family DNA segregation ATPase FtsK/SpoIIIE